MKTVTTLYDKYLGNLSIHGWRDPQNPQLAQIFMEDKIYIPRTRMPISNVKYLRILL